MSSFKCGQCQFTSQWMFVVKEHMRLHIFAANNYKANCTRRVERYKCRDCKYRTDLLIRLQTHISISHNYNREFEDKDFKVTNSNETDKILEYKKDIPTSSIWKCTYCTFVTKRKESLKFHIYRLHTRLEDRTWYNCPHCPFRSIIKSKLSIHIQRKHTSSDLGNWYHCPHCHVYRTRTASDLKTHILHRHTPDDQVKWFVCERCSYKCKLKGDLNKHIARKHTAQESITTYDCPHCTTHKSKALADLKIHILRKHTPDDQIKWHECEVCGFKTKMRWTLGLHLQRRHNINDASLKLYAKNRYNPRDIPNPDIPITLHYCPHCSFTAKRRYNLMLHIEKKHSLHEEPERTHFCSKCDFRAKAVNDLKIHMLRKHTPEEEINWSTCPYCTHKAKLKTDLTKHIQRKHGTETSAKWYECPNCTSYKTRSAADLKSHILHIHTPPDKLKKLFMCPLCTYKAIKSYQLKRHIKAMHKSVDLNTLNVHDYAVSQEPDVKEEQSKVDETEVTTN